MSYHNINITLGIVFYKPTEKQLNNLKRYAEIGIFNDIFVCDNTPTQIHYDNSLPCVHYFYMGYNSGLSKPYNLMIEKAILNNSDYLCIMDQDTPFKEEDVLRVVQFIQEHQDSLEDVAIVCPNVVKNTNVPINREGLSYVKWAINSTSFLNIKNINRNHLRYDEKIFLDGVDYEFCLNIMKHGQKILRINDIVVIQEFGYVANGDATFTHHNADRYFNIAHNRKYIFYKHYGFYGWAFALLQNIRLVCRVAIHEDEKSNKIKACIRGILK